MKYYKAKIIHKKCITIIKNSCGAFLILCLVLSILKV